MDSEIINNSFRVRAFRAVDEYETCGEYIKEHVKVLTDFGIINITSNNKSWTGNPNMYCVVAEHMASGELVGGIRIQVADGIFPLPVEDAIGYMDKVIYEKVRYYAQHGGVGELCGLWVSNKLKGLGMAVYLVRAAIASAKQLQFQTMIGICAGYSLSMFENVGFIIDYSLGDNGNFQYPDERYIAHVVGILDALTLETAAAPDKLLMLALRTNFVQERVEVNKNFRTNIMYNLVYPKITETTQKL